MCAELADVRRARADLALLVDDRVVVLLRRRVERERRPAVLHREHRRQLVVDEARAELRLERIDEQLRDGRRGSGGSCCRRSRTWRRSSGGESRRSSIASSSACVVEGVEERRARGRARRAVRRRTGSPRVTRARAASSTAKIWLPARPEQAARGRGPMRVSTACTPQTLRPTSSPGAYWRKRGITREVPTNATPPCEARARASSRAGARPARSAPSCDDADLAVAAVVDPEPARRAGAPSAAA